MLKISDESSLKSCASQLFNATPSMRTFIFLVNCTLFNSGTHLTGVQQEHPSPAPSSPDPKSKLHKRKDALLSPTAVLERETIRSASNSHSTPSSPPSRLLP